MDYDFFHSDDMTFHEICPPLRFDMKKATARKQSLIPER